MKDFKIAKSQMLGAYRAGKSVKYIVQISGASASTVRYWIKHESLHTLQIVTRFNRMWKRKGFRTISRHTAHNYIAHDSGQKNCEFCSFPQAIFT